MSVAKHVIVDVKLDNILVNYGDGDIQFSDVQLPDLGGTQPIDSKYARERTPVGAPMWTSPEVIMETPWNTATDIWSFGTVVGSPPHFPGPANPPCVADKSDLRWEFQFVPAQDRRGRA